MLNFGYVLKNEYFNFFIFHIINNIYIFVISVRISLLYNAFKNMDNIYTKMNITKILQKRGLHGIKTDIDKWNIKKTYF